MPSHCPARAAVMSLAVLAGCVPAATGGFPSYPPAAGRAITASTGEPITMAQLAQQLRAVDVVFVGEEHGDSSVHRAERELLAATAALGRPIIVSLEMFERDVQPAVDAYRDGRIAEADFLARSRPWRRYATDYRPLVELAREHGWAVVAANVPRSIAAAVSRSGLTALDSLPSAERAHAAADVQCPRDAYRERFVAEMRAHPVAGGAGSDPEAMAERFYLAQCVKDETMAESIVAALAGAPRGALLLHFTGSFHSSYRQGTVERVLRRAPRLSTVVLAALSAGDSLEWQPARRRARADYLIPIGPR